MKTTGPLSQTIDRVNAAFFWGNKLSADERKSLAHSIAATHDQEGAYAHTFALSAKERKVGVLLFTGERTLSAAARHISGEEACRALRLLNVEDQSVAAALTQASERLLKCLQGSERATAHRMGGNPGVFCCGRCTVSVWRHILTGGFDRKNERLRGGLKRLKESRNGGGKWGVFPFWYTMSALAEMDLPDARREIEYAAPQLERAAGRKTARSEYDRRRSEIARRALAKL